MSWGTELWDQYDNLSAHTQKGIDFLERYGHFVRDRCAIETEYASKLRRLVKNYHPKKKEEEEYQYSSCRAFKLVLNEVNDLAGQHEVVAENLQANVIKELSALVKDMREDRKKHLNEGTKQMSILANQIATLDRSKRSYEKAFKEAERAVENFQKADKDLNLSRAEVEKQRHNMTLKSQICDTAKNEYADQLQRTNEMQRIHYQTVLPDVFRHLQELDEKRIKNIKNFIHSTVEIERNVFPIISQCWDGIVRAGDCINEKQDSLLVIERYKSGFQPPDDFPFEDLSRQNSLENGSTHHVNSTPGINDRLQPGYTVKGTISAGKIKKRVGIFNIFGSNKNVTSVDGKEDFSDLPPNQRRKRLVAKIDELQTKIGQEQAARDGLMKMKGVYESNSALGDPMSIEGQLNECAHKLEKLRAELKRYQGYLEEATKGPTLAAPGSSPGGPRGLLNGASRNHRNSGGSAADEESLSRSASDSSVTNPTINHNKPSAPGTPQLNHGSSNSPESGLGTSHTSLPGMDSDPDQYDGANPEMLAEGEEEYDEEYMLPALGTCKALYPFEATSEGSIPMSENEKLFMIEVDQGDGWTRVRRMSGDCEEGFVPTSYIETSLYSNT